MKNTNRKKISAFTSLLLVSLFSVSCGTNTANLYASLPMNTGISSVPDSRQDAKEILQISNAAYAAVEDFTGIVTIEDSKNGDPNNVDIGESKFFFKKDRRERLEITKSADSKIVNSILIYEGGEKVEILLAKAIPFLGRKFKLKVDDKRLATSRGLAFDQLDLTAMLNRMNRDGVQHKYLGEGSVNGRRTFVIEGTGTFRGLDSEVTREVLNIDQETMIPVQDEVFISNNRRVLRIGINNLKTNVGLKDDTFVLPDSRMAVSR